MILSSLSRFFFRCCISRRVISISSIRLTLLSILARNTSSALFRSAFRFASKNRLAGCSIYVLRVFKLTQVVTPSSLVYWIQSRRFRPVLLIQYFPNLSS